MAGPRLVFEMKLPRNEQKNVVRGKLTAYEGDEIALRAEATSGKPGYQYFGNYWERSLAPLPPGEYQLETERQVTQDPSLFDDMGRFHFHLEPYMVCKPGVNPDDIKDPETDPRCRTAFLLHLDGPFDPYAEDLDQGVGTKGCIGTRAFNDFARWIANVRDRGIERIPLTVTYVQQD